jgi:hypothetical protein
LSEFQGVRVGEFRGRGRRVGDLEGDAYVSGDAAADLDLVDERGVRRIGEFQRGAYGFEDGDAASGRGERAEFGQSEHIPVEVQRRPDQ